MVALPTLLLSPEESRDRNGPVTPTLNGGVITVPSSRNEWVETEGTTNLIPDPAFMVSTPNNSWWETSRSTSPPPAISGNTFIAKYSAGDAALYNIEERAVTPAAGETYTGSIYVWTDTPRTGKNVRLRLGFRGGIAEGYSDWLALSTTPTRIQATATTIAGTTSRFMVAHFQGLVAGDTIYISNRQLEQKPYATPYADGDMANGEWTGTPNASASTRKYSKVAVGKQINAWQISEATTNLISNPSFEVGATPWSPAGGTGAISTDRSYAGSKSYRYQVTTGSPQRVVTGWSNTLSAAASTTYTLSAWVFNASGSARVPRLLVEFPDGSGSLKESTADSVLPGQWQRLVFTFTTYATTTRVAPQIHFGRTGSGTVSGDIWYIDAIQLEQKAYATPYADGDMGAGHAWTGTPHASTSTRSRAGVSINHLPSLEDVSSGTVIVRYKQNALRSGQGYIYNRGYLNLAGSGWTAIVLPSSGALRGSFQPINTSSSVGVDASLSDDEQKTAVIRWNNTDVGVASSPSLVFTNGQMSGPIETLHQTIRLGTDFHGQQVANIDIESALIFDTVLSDADIAMINRMHQWKWEYFVPPTPIPPPPPRPPITATMTDLRPYPIMATIAGIPTDVQRYDRSHGVDQPVATGSITLPLPLPEHLRGGQPGDVLNLPVSIQVGYRESVLRPVFNGYIRRDRMELSRNGYYATLSMVGYGTLLSWPESRDLVFSSNYLDEIIRSLCERRGVPKYRIDRILTPSGQRVRMGGNSHIDDGKVIIPAGTSPLDWMTRLLRLFGYRAFDTAQEFRVHRVSGAPTLGPMAEFAEGKLIHRLSRDRDLDDVVTVWTVEGATYTDDDGIQIPIRSLPGGTVPYEPLLDPPGYREAPPIRDNQIVTQVNADAARQIAEIDHAKVNPQWSISTRGNSLYRPGATVRIASSNMEAAADDCWLMSVKDAMDSRQGYKAVLTAWKGGGTALPDGEDLQTINVREAPIHLGDELVPWYAVPQATGKEFSIPITVPDTFTSLAISLYLHGSNNYQLDGNTESTVSKIIVMQNGEEVGSAELPVVPEDYNLQLPYGDGLTHWQQFRLPVPGRLEAGSAEIKIVSGEDKRLPEFTKFDDFEARNITLELRGAGMPELPSMGGD